MIFEIYFEKVEDAEKAGMYRKFNNVMAEHHKNFNFFSIILPEVIVTTTKAVEVLIDTTTTTTTVTFTSTCITKNKAPIITTDVTQTPPNTPSTDLTFLPIITTTSVIKTPKKILSDFIKEIYTNKIASLTENDLVNPHMINLVNTPVSYPVKFTMWNNVTNKFEQLTI